MWRCSTHGSRVTGARVAAAGWPQTAPLRSLPLLCPQATADAEAAASKEEAVQLRAGLEKAQKAAKKAEEGKVGSRGRERSCRRCCLI